MGTAASMPFKYLKNIYYKYNAQYRALKFIENEKIPRASKKIVHTDNKISNEKYSELYEKDEKLDEYLKKVYLKSNDGGGKIIKSTRPLPVKRAIGDAITFYEPPEPQPQCLTLSTAVKILLYHQGDPKINVAELAQKYSLNKNSLMNLLMYYSLFKKEDFDFMRKNVATNEAQPQQIEFEVFTRLEKKPLKQIEGEKQ